MNALVIPLTLTKKDFETNAESARKDVARLTGTVNETSAALTVMKRAAREAGDAVDAGLTSKINETKKALVSLKSELKTAKADYQVLSEVVPAPRPAPANPKSGHGSGADRMRGAELGHSARSVMDMLSAGQSPVQATMMEVPRLLQAFGGGLGAIVGVGALASIGQKLVEAHEEARQLKKDLDALGAPMPVGASASVGEIDARLKKTAETMKDLEAARSGFWHVLGGAMENRIKHPLDGGIGTAVARTGDEDDANIRAAEAERARMTHQLAARQGIDNGLNARAFSDGEDSVAIERIRNKYARERAEIEERVASGELASDTELVARSKEREALEIQIEQHKLQAAREAIELESTLLTLKREGLDVERQSAAAKLEAAKKTLAEGPKSGEVHDRNVNAVESAQQAFEQAGRNAARTRAAEVSRSRETEARGSDTDDEVSKARRALHEARRNRDTTVVGTDERRNANLAVKASEVDLRDAGRRKDAAQASVALEEKIVGIKRAGYQVDLQIAQARLQTAKDLLEKGPKQGGEHDKLQAAADAAQLNVEMAAKETGEKEKQAELETRIANLRGSSDQVRRATLAAERQDIERRLAVAKPDERPAIVAEQARNQQQQDEFAKNEKLRDIADQEGHDRASAGHSFADQINLLNQELQRNADRQKWNADENGGDKHMGAQLDDTAEQLKRALDDVTFAEQQRLTALRNQQTQIQNHGYQATVATKDQDIDAKYDAQVSQEKHGKNDPVALAQLETNRTAEKFDAAVDEEMMTPAQRRARDRANRRREQAAARVADRQKRHEEAQAADQSTFDDTFHRPGGNHMPGPQHMEAHGHMPDRRIQGADANPAGGKLSMAGVESILHSHTQILSTIAQNAIFKEMA